MGFAPDASPSAALLFSSSLLFSSPFCASPSPPPPPSPSSSLLFHSFAATIIGTSPAPLPADDCRNLCGSSSVAVGRREVSLRRHCATKS